MAGIAVRAGFIGPARPISFASFIYANLVRARIDQDQIMLDGKNKEKRIDEKQEHQEPENAADPDKDIA